MAMFAAVAFLLLASHCAHHDMPRAEKITVAVPERTPGTAIVAQVVVGPLPRGARVIVRLDDGEVVGSVSPYGMQAAASGGSYTIPLPDRVAEKRSLNLQFEVQETRDASMRPPKKGEIVRVELHAVPVKH